MLKLAEETRADWLAEALGSLDEVMIDHAHCEKKAAGGAIRLLFGYPHIRAFQDPLAALAREELLHFQQVLRLLERRGVEFVRQIPSPYAGMLHKSLRSNDPERLIDILLVSALIEARSCERMKLLGEAPIDPELATFYRGLLACEARHFHVYVDLANEVADASEVAKRLDALAEAEAEVLRTKGPAPRMHS